MIRSGGLFYDKRSRRKVFLHILIIHGSGHIRRSLKMLVFNSTSGLRGFDPGVTQAYCAYALKHEFDTIDTIDILDCNGGDSWLCICHEFQS